MRVYWQVLCLMLSGWIWCAQVLAQTSVSAFAPSGQVKEVRQVTARFSAPMVAFGDPRGAAPFDIDCPAEGSGRWIDASTWSYDFTQDVPAALSCRFTLRADSHDLAGAALTGQRAFAFDTGGPSVAQSLPYEGASDIDEKQVFLLALDAPVKLDSVASLAWCRADGINEKIPVRVLAGVEREALFAAQRGFVNRHMAEFAKARGQQWRTSGALKEQLRADLPLLALECRRTLPADTDVALVWGKGIASLNGIVTSADQVLAYHTRAPFRAAMRCQRTNARAGCVPFLPLQLSFSAPVKLADARAMALVSTDGKRYAPQFDADEVKAGLIESASFDGPFPELASLRLALPQGLKDDSGRPLATTNLPPVRIDRAPPLLKFAAPFGIIEARGERLLPVTVRNVEAKLAVGVRSRGTSLRVTQETDVLAWFRKLNRSKTGVDSPREQSGTALTRQLLGTQADGAVERFSLPKPQGKQVLEVIGIPLPKPGFYVVELSSAQLGAAINDKGRTAYVHTAALVTNLAAHLKLGAESSLVWVTTLDKGRPVAQAKVALRSCSGKLLWSGSTNASGVAQIRQALPASHCNDGSGYFVSARSGDDFTFTLSEWQRGIESWRFKLPTEAFEHDSRIGVSVFDRSLLRAGETVHMKHFLRRRQGNGLALVKASDAAPRSVPGWPVAEAAEQRTPQPPEGWLLHQGSGKKISFHLAWDAAGQAHSAWTIPADSELGEYEVVIAGQVTGSFRVEQFRVPTMKALLAGPALPVVAAGSVALQAQVNYLAGGAAAQAPVKLRSVLEARSPRFEQYPEYAFGNGDVKLGVETSGGMDDEDAGEDEAQGAGSSSAARTQSLTLDRNGGARIVVPDLPAVSQPHSLLAELSYQDANGETLSSATRVQLWPAQLLAGIRSDAWTGRGPRSVSVVLLDVSGKPVAGHAVDVDIFQRETYSHRRRLVGGFYAYENNSEVKALGPLCSKPTDARGELVCTLPAASKGELIVRARAVDAGGRASITHTELWLGSDDNWFAASDNDRVDLLPVKARVEPGQEASFQLRMPFRAATVLVTVEREGILDTYVRQLEGNDPIIHIPVKAHYAPNVFVSALAVRGRVAGVQPTALVDLGKPAYKLGIAPLQVGWAAHALQVQVSTDKPVYKVRERVAVEVKVTRADGKALPAGAEIALAAVDAGLLELKPNDSWNLLQSMMRERALQVETSTAQMQVVGKRHFGRKAVAHGGGGGRGASRELFDTLLLWQGKVTLDANGVARIPVQLNDSLSSFRIVAIASAGAGLFGTGAAEVRSTQDLMLLSGLPPLVRSGDRLRAGFTVRNASTRALDVQLAAALRADQAAPLALAAQRVTLAAGAAQEVFWDVSVPPASSLRWQVEARAGKGTIDQVSVTQNVAAPVPLTTLQATLLQLGTSPSSLSVAQPAGALAGLGGIRSSFSASLAGNMEGVRDYMRAYPYTCFEQRTSRAVALRDSALWQRVAASLPAHLDDDGLLKFFPTMHRGDDSLTAYVLSVAHEAGLTLAPEQRERMAAGLLAFVQGKISRGASLRTGELAVRKLAALEALSRHETVRNDWIESFVIAPNQWPTSAVIDWYLVLRRSPALREQPRLLAEAGQILRVRLNLQGTTMGFSTERSDDWWWLMASPDVNANRLLLAVLDDPAWKADIGRLARGTLGRQQQGRWGTTLANAWGVLALEKFAQRFEATPVTGKASVQVAGSTPVAVAVPGSVLQPWPAPNTQLTLRHEGSGKPWVSVQSLAALPLTAPLSSGYRIVRSITAVEQAHAPAWSRGDVYRVRLDIDAQADMNWVVVDDPIPASASILGTGLGRDAQIASSGERRSGWVQPEFEERTHGAFRAYYSFVPKGNWRIEYTVRLNNQGSFKLPPTRVEAMYSPEMFGALPNAPVVVGP